VYHFVPLTAGTKASGNIRLCWTVIEDSMKRSSIILLAVILGAAISFSCGAAPDDNVTGALRSGGSGAIYRQFDPDQIPAALSHGAFHDRTEELLSEALTLIDRNEREGAALDQRWYAFRRFGEHLEQILKANQVRFYGGREAEVIQAVGDNYASITPIEPDQDPGEIRLFTARRDSGRADVIIIGQNGREVALKTVIRLAYLFKFMNPELKRVFTGGLDSFLRRIKIYFSSTPPRQEFISFFRRHGISDPDAVIVGFQGDSRAVLKEAGIVGPELYSSDSLRVNWYPHANGQKVLLVSINGNRIFASRAGELVNAMLDAFRSPPRTLVFFGSAGAIDAAKLIGQIVAPTVVVANDYFHPERLKGKLAHIIRNRAAMLVPVKTAHISVESVIVETVNWAAAINQKRIMTVDQELYHVIDAINASPDATNIHIFVGMLITDNVGASQAPDMATLEHAQNVIDRTVALRRHFLANVLAVAGIIPNRSATKQTKAHIEPRATGRVSKPAASTRRQ
jgi:hypothetical protein